MLPERVLDDATAITAAQLRAVVERLIAAGQWTPGAPDITIVMDAGYDVTRLAWVLRDLPVELVGQIRGDRVMRLPRPPLQEYALAHPQGGRPPKHGKEFRFNKPEAWPEPAITTATDTMNYGKAEAQAWHRVHPRLTHRSAWLDHDGELPIVEGTLVRLKAEHLSKEREAPPVWLWSSKTGAAPGGRGPLVAGVSEEIRPGAHLQVRKTDARLDHPEAAYTRSRGPLDLAPGRRAHPAPPRPTWPGSAGASGTSEPTCSVPPVFPNLVAPVPDDRPGPRTATPHPATTSAKPSNALRPSRPSADPEDPGS